MRKDRPRAETLQGSIDAAIESLKAIRPNVPRLMRLADDYERGFGAGGIGGATGGDVSRPTERQALAQIPFDEAGVEHPAPADPAREIDDWVIELNEAIAHCQIVDTHHNGLLPRGLPPEVEGVFCLNCARYGRMIPAVRAVRCWACYVYRRRSVDGVTERPRELVVKDDLTREHVLPGVTCPDLRVSTTSAPVVTTLIQD